MASVPQFEEKRVVSLFTVLAYLGLVFVGLWLIYELRRLLPPLLVATIIAMALTPEVDIWERRGLRRGLAIAVIYLLFLTTFGLVLWGLIPHISEQMGRVVSHLLPPSLIAAKPQDMEALAAKWLAAHHIPAVARPPVLNQARQIPLFLNQGLQWVSGNIPNWAGNLVWVIAIPIITFFILLDFYKILGKFLILAPPNRREGILGVVTDIIAVFGSYVRGVLTVMGLDISVTLIVLSLFGLQDLALTIAVTSGILYTIPYFGAITSTLMIGLVVLTTHGAGPAIAATIVMVVYHQIFLDNFVSPRIIGRSVNLHPLLILLSLMAGGTLLGIGGLLMAVPVAAAAQIILVHLFPQFETDVVARRLAPVVKTSVDAKTAAVTPPARQQEDPTILQNEADAAHAEAEEPPPLLPQTIPRTPRPARTGTDS